MITVTMIDGFIERTGVLHQFLQGRWGLDQAACEENAGARHPRDARAGNVPDERVQRHRAVLDAIGKQHRAARPGGHHREQARPMARGSHPPSGIFMALEPRKTKSSARKPSRKVSAAGRLQPPRSRATVERQNRRDRHGRIDRHAIGPCI